MNKSKTAKRYTREFRAQIVDLVRAGRKPRELSHEFGCTPWTIRVWVKQAARNTHRIVMEDWPRRHHITVDEY